MSDHIQRLLSAFGKLLARLRTEQKLTQETFATVARLSVVDVSRMELGEREPTLRELFQIAEAVSTPPAILLMKIVAEWRTDPRDHGLYKSRASDIEWLYRLGFHRDPGDFRELARTYGSLDEATGAARLLNTTRKVRGQPLIRTVLVYVRLTSIGFRPDSDEVRP
jgi:transcriptional regulator with XRE-family HTH domain